ncbi:MAG: lipopolysaccharide biosynthesis protein [Chitinophagales bacterium]
MELKRTLFKNFLAGGWGKISAIVFRLIQVPVLLWFLGVEEYGRWLVLYTLPSWLTLANLGFGSVAANDISMAIGKGDITKARTIFSSAFRVVTYIFIGGLILILPLILFLQWDKLLKVSPERHNELIGVLIWFTLSTLLSFFGEIFQARFRAARKAHVYIWLYSLRPWIELLFMIIILQFTVRLDYLALAVFSSTVIFILLTQWTSYRAMPALKYSVHDVDKTLLRPLFKKGIAFQAFPLGNALIYQGTIIVVQMILGPVAVAVFGTVRTLIRSINQMLELINQVMWPELSILFGMGDLQKAARLHRIGVVVSVIVALFFVLFLGLFGEKIFSWWTGGSIVLSKTLLLLFLLPIPFNSLWFTSSVIHMASNKHEGLALRYLVAMGLAVTGCAVFSYFFGMEGAAVSTVIADIVLIPYVFRVSLSLTEDNMEKFFRGIKYEVQLIPAFFKKFRTIH